MLVSFDNWDCHQNPRHSPKIPDQQPVREPDDAPNDEADDETDAGHEFGAKEESNICSPSMKLLGSVAEVYF